VVPEEEPAMPNNRVLWASCAALIVLVGTAAGGLWWFCHRVCNRETPHPPPTVRPAAAPEEIGPADPF
jgi:hypothetical protein